MNFEYGARDWPEDENFDDDNAHYQHTCPECKNTFIGHKRRNGGLCKLCWIAKQPANHLVQKDFGELELAVVSAGAGHAEIMRGIMEAQARAGMRSEIVTLEFVKTPDPVEDLRFVSAKQKTYVPALPGKHRRRR